MLWMSKEMTNQEVADLLRQVAAAYEVKDDDFFRVRAYQNAAASIEHATSDLHDLWQEDKLDEVPGVGPNLKQHLNELFRTGKVKHFISETKGLPEGMFALLDVAGIGPKTAFKLAKQFKLTEGKTALKKLRQVAEKGLIAKLPGFGKQSETEILKATKQEAFGDRMLLPQAQMLADEVRGYLDGCKEAEKIEALGSLRRKTGTVGDVDLAVATRQPEKVMEYLLQFKGIKKVLSTGPKTTMFIHSSGRQVDVKTQEPGAWGSILQHYTGSKLHNIKLRTYALEKGMSLSEHGIKQRGRLKEFATEAEFYKYLGLKYIPPELREDAGEIEAAQGKPDGLPNLVEEADIKGDLHVHTNVEIATSHDEGESSVKEILEEVIKLEYEYIGLSDHNPKRELSQKDKLEIIRRRCEVIEKEVATFEKDVKKRVPHVLTGLEVDIRVDGELAIGDKELELLDYAVVSIHVAFEQSKEEATRRVLTALAHPKVRIFGHPTGRKLQRRQGLDYDWDKVFDFCVKHNKWLEVNASVDRMDLPDVLIREAVEGGVKLIVNSDSHAVEHLKFLKYGVWNARRGWAQKRDIVNTLSWAEFVKLLKKEV